MSSINPPNSKKSGKKSKKSEKEDPNPYAYASIPSNVLPAPINDVKYPKGTVR